MPELKTKSPYLLETAKGAIELTKGMYLSLIRRRALVGKNTSKKEMENEEDQAKTARKNQHSHYRKLIGKARTVKKTSKVNPDPILQNKRYVSLSKGLYRKRFELYEDSHIFPQEIQQFQVHICKLLSFPNNSIMTVNQTRRRLSWG